MRASDQIDTPMRNSSKKTDAGNRRSIHLHIPAAAIAAVLGLTACGEGTFPGASAPLVPAAGTPAPAAAQPLPDFTALVDKVGAAVVNISTVRAIPAGDAEPQADDTPAQPFHRFGPAPGDEEEEPAAEGVGSGFIVSADGYVLTNSHVVADAAEVIVRLTDKRELKARVVGTDDRTDIALLKVEGKDLPHVVTGDAAKARVGEWVVAVGSPFGFENTVTAGIISATARALPDEDYVPFIQTSVPINPGNSGGPLFNLKGEVIGINAQILSDTGGFMGLSFAIPIDLALRVMKELQQHGHVARGHLGVVPQELSKELAAAFGLEPAKGVLLTDIQPGSPAAKAGLRPGDIVIGINDQPVQSPSELVRIIGDLRPGDAARIGLWREGKPSSVTATLDEQAAEPPAAAGAGESAGVTVQAGITVRELTAQEKREFNLSGGVLVEHAKGIAARAGLQPGDVVLAINSEQVTDTKQFSRLLENPGKSIALLVQRGERRTFVPLPLS
jgi:serine protease Do